MGQALALAAFQSEITYWPGLFREVLGSKSARRWADGFGGELGKGPSSEDARSPLGPFD